MFDLLLGLSDFQAFKALMLDYRRAAAGPAASLGAVGTAAATTPAAGPQQQPQQQTGFGRAPDTRRAADQAQAGPPQQLAGPGLVVGSSGSEHSSMKAAAATSPGRMVRVGVCDAADMDT